MNTNWTIEIGETTTRAALHATYGPSTQGGIAPALASRNLFLFSDPAKAENAGYSFDGLSSDGLAFDYTGTGRSGDQKLNGLNGSVLRHETRALRLRIFIADGKVGSSDTTVQKYLGEFRVDPADGLAYRHVPSRDVHGEERIVIVFRLLPQDSARSLHLTPPPITAAPSGTAVLVAPEADNVYLSTRPEVGVVESHRAEAKLTTRYQRWLNNQGRVALRWSITLPDGKTTLLTDLYLGDEKLLIEAKASPKRDSVRLAIGQLLDYSRHLQLPGLRRSILLPSPPVDDLLELLRALGIGCIVATNERDFQTILEADAGPRHPRSVRKPTALDPDEQLSKFGIGLE